MKILIFTTGRADWSGLGMVWRVLMSDYPRFTVEVASMVGGDPALLQAMAEDEAQLMPGGPHRGAAAPVALEVFQPDLAIICGDRHEALAAAFACHLARVPVCHLAGGDLTYGSQDDSMRHAISKLACLHLPTHPDSARRLIRMGEAPSRVTTVGSPAVDRIVAMADRLPERAEAMARIWGEGPPDRFIMVNWQPETMADDPNQGLKTILWDLVEAKVSTMRPVLFIGQGLDRGAAEARDNIARFVANVPMRCRIVDSLKPSDYLAALKYCDCLVGNSSSLIYEAPLFGTPSFMVGERQRGRPLARCVVSVKNARGLVDDLQTDWSKYPRRQPEYLFGRGHAAQEIVKVLRELPDPKRLLQKVFYDPDLG